MALNVAKGVLTQPGSTGNQTISLASNFDPKAIIMWATNLAATGDDSATDPHAFAIGAGTYRGSSVQHWTFGVAATNSDAASTNGVTTFASDALLKLTNTTPTVDLEIDLVSMQTGATSEVVVNFVNLFTTASIKIHYMILGGSDISDAEAITTTTVAAATQDISATAGFGQPDLFFVGAFPATGTHGSTVQLSLGWGNDALEQGAHVEQSFDATTVGMGHYQRADRIILGLSGSAASPVEEYAASLSATGSWPTDGIQLTWDNQAGVGQSIGLLFLKGSFQSKIGETSSPTAAAPQDLDIGLSFTPVGAVAWGGALAASTSISVTNNDLGQQMFGASDGTNEGYAGWNDDDAQANQRFRTRHSDSKIFGQVTNAVGVVSLLTEADAVFQTNNLRLTFTTTNATARAFLYVALGSAGGGGQSVSPTGLASASSFGTVETDILFAVNGLSSASAFGSPTLVPGVATVAPASLASAADFGSPVMVPGVVAVVVTGLDSASAFGAASAGSVTNVPVSGIGSASSFGTLTILPGGTVVQIVALDSASAFGAPSTDGGVPLTFNPAVHGGRHRR